jgi:predicted XRE-type DNA-binding protein
MDPKKKKRLESLRWKVGTVQEFLELTDEEAALVEIRVRLALALSSLRKAANMTQTEPAKAIGSSQSRVAKMEARDDSVSIDLMIQALAKLGADANTIGSIIASEHGRIGAKIKPVARRMARQ